MLWKNSVYQKISGSEKRFCIRKGYHDFPSNFLSHSIEKLLRRTLLCFTKNLVSKVSMDRRGHHGFVEHFCTSQCQKNSLGNTSVFQKVFWYRKNFMDRRGWGITIFCQFFSLTLPKNFVGEPFCVSGEFWYRNFSWLGGGGGGGGAQVLVTKKLSHKTKNFRMGSFLCFRSFLIWRKFMYKRWEGGVSRFSAGIFLSHIAKNFCRGTFLGFSKLRASENFFAKDGRGGVTTLH